jgi:hypothetical protein
MKKAAFIFLILLSWVFIMGSWETQDGRLRITNNVNINPTAWDDIRVPLTRARILGQASDADFDVYKGSVRAFTFDDTTDEEIFFSVQLPHNFTYGTNIHPHVHWAPTNTNTGDVRWCLEYTLAEEGGTFGGTTTDCFLSAGTGTADEHILAEFSDIDGSAIDTLSAMLLCRLYRDANHVDDDYNADAVGLEIDFHYEIDDFGSRLEAVK